MQVALLTVTDVDQIMETLADDLSVDELVQFIVDLDLMYASWEFTELLYKYFKAQHKIFKAEC